MANEGSNLPLAIVGNYIYAFVISTVLEKSAVDVKIKQQNSSVLDVPNLMSGVSLLESGKITCPLTSSKVFFKNCVLLSLWLCLPSRFQTALVLPHLSFPGFGENVASFVVAGSPGLLMCQQFASL